VARAEIQELILPERSHIAPRLSGSPLEGRPLPPAFVTISVDDGHPSDLATAELLAQLGLKATFYIPKSNPERAVLAPAQISEIATTFEIGGHTLHHLPLVQLPQTNARDEIWGCKQWLEDLLGRPALSFCYPRGKYNSSIRNFVAQAGFRGARTCHFNLNHASKDPFQVGVSTHAFSHSTAVQLRHAILQRNFKGMVNYVLVHRMTSDWQTHFRISLDWVEKNGGVAHLYLHSWEIEERNEWRRLADTLRDAASRTRVKRITNGDLFSLLNPNNN
jgi:peptidoglycan/xylan/chitin deacetylase (PgdA/CDA1 family)